MKIIAVATAECFLGMILAGLFFGWLDGAGGRIVYEPGFWMVMSIYFSSRFYKAGKTVAMRDLAAELEQKLEDPDWHPSKEAA